MDLSVGLLLPRDRVFSSGRLLSLLVDSWEEERERTHSFAAGTFSPGVGLLPGLPRLREDRGRVLVFLGAARPEGESLEGALRSPELTGLAREDPLSLLNCLSPDTLELLGLARAGLLSPLPCRDRTAFLVPALERLRGRVP